MATHPLFDRAAAAQRAAASGRARSQRLLRHRAALIDRQRRLRLARCGEGFRVLGLARRSEGGRIEVRTGEVPVIALVGEVDLGHAEELRARLEMLAVDHPRVVIDLTETVFMDSSIVHALVKSYRAGLEITIRGRHSAARRAIELMGLDAIFHVEE